MKELNNLINILEELKDDYFEGGLTDFDVVKVLMDNIDDLISQLNVYRNMRKSLGD